MLIGGAVAPVAGYLLSGTAGASAVAGGGKLEDELFIYTWVGYTNPKTFKQFEKKFGVNITVDTYASNEDALAKLQAGAEGYDIVVPTGYMVEIMAGEGLLAKIDKSKIPNLKKFVDERFLDAPFDPKNRHSVPKDYGTTGFGYRSDLIDEEPTTWEEFFDLAPKYSGKYTILDGATEGVGIALKSLGYSWNTTKQSEIDEATEQLAALKPHLLTITSSEYKALLTTGEAVFSSGWNGDFLAVQADVPDVTYVIPTEGSEIWLDNWCILEGAPNPNAAHAFINFVLKPKIQAQETSFTYYGSPVSAAKPFLPAEIAENPGIYPPPEIEAALELTDGTAEIFQLRTDAWTEFKAS